MTRVLEPARLRTALRELGASAAVIAVALALGLLIVALAGFSAGDTIDEFIKGAFVGSLSMDTTLELTIPLVLAALAWTVAFRAGRINVGAEGQILMGGAAATAVGIYVHLPLAPHLALTVLAAASGGALWAGVAAVLWAWRGVNEVISTFMLNLIAALFVLYLVGGPLQEPNHRQAISASIPDSARWPTFFGQSSLSWDIALIPVAVLVVWFVVNRTTAGFKLRMTGGNPEAARHAGVDVKRVGVAALLGSGALAGLAASSMLLSVQGGFLQQGFSSNYGFYGIAVALVARNSPMGAIPAAFVFAALLNGGGLAQATVGIDLSLVEILLGIVVVLSAATAYLATRRRRGRRRRGGRPAGRLPRLADSPRDSVGASD